MKFRYREMVYRPDFYAFDNRNRTEWFRNGFFTYNVSRMIIELACHDTDPEDCRNYLNPVIKVPVSVSEAIIHNHGIDGLEPKNVAHADTNRPLIYVEIAPDSFNLIDGHHRLAKAQSRGIEKLEAYFLPADVAVRYLENETQYNRYVEYWNSKIEDIRDEENYIGLFAPVPALLLERDLSSQHIWNRMAICLNECRRVELYTEGKWFTLFRLNGRLFCGEAEAHYPTIRCSVPWELTEMDICELLPSYEDWQNRYLNDAQRKNARRNIRKANRHAEVIMACIRVFSEY